MEPPEKENATSEKSGEPEKIPLGQTLLDNIWLLLTLGLSIPLILYIIWGIFDIINVPPFSP